MGCMYNSGLGVNEDCDKAVMWFRRAAEKGIAHAQLGLGIAYISGEGLEEDNVSGHMWCSLAAMQWDGDTTKVESLEIATEALGLVEENMTAEQIAKAQKLVHEWNANSPEIT